MKRSALCTRASLTRSKLHFVTIQHCVTWLCDTLTLNSMLLCPEVRKKKIVSEAFETHPIFMKASTMRVTHSIQNGLKNKQKHRFVSK